MASYAAIPIFPIVTIFAHMQPSVGTAIAAVFSLAGNFLRWHSESLRLDAEYLHRTTEYSRGLGHTVDRKRYADLSSKYDRLIRRTPTREPELQDYYDANDPPSQATLLRMLRESSWWTERLSSKMTRIVGGALAVILLVVVSFLVLSDPATDYSTDLKVYGLFICSILSIDIIYLCLGYRRLAEAAGKSFDEFDALLGRSNFSDRDVLIAAANYQFSRSSAPPLPSWLWKFYRKSLNAIWQETLSTKWV